MGTIDRCPRRKYHSLLTVREPGIGEPLNLVAELEEWFEVGGETFALHSYDCGNVVEPNGMQYLVEFEPQPRWTYRFAGLTIIRELWLEDGADAVWLRCRAGDCPGDGHCRSPVANPNPVPPAAPAC